MRYSELLWTPGRSNFPSLFSMYKVCMWMYVVLLWWRACEYLRCVTQGFDLGLSRHVPLQLYYCTRCGTSMLREVWDWPLHCTVLSATAGGESFWLSPIRWQSRAVISMDETECHELRTSQSMPYDGHIGSWWKKAIQTRAEVTWLQPEQRAKTRAGMELQRVAWEGCLRGCRLK